MVVVVRMSRTHPKVCGDLALETGRKGGCPGLCPSWLSPPLPGFNCQGSRVLRGPLHRAGRQGAHGGSEAGGQAGHVPESPVVTPWTEAPAVGLRLR